MHLAIPPACQVAPPVCWANADTFLRLNPEFDRRRWGSVDFRAAYAAFTRTQAELRGIEVSPRSTVSSGKIAVNSLDN
jgi:hypothetical protein